jgi:hypothetical protein
MRLLVTCGLLLIVACPGGRRDAAGGDPIVSCRSTMIAVSGDCDPNRVVCDLDDGGTVEIKPFSKCPPRLPVLRP